MKTYYVEGGHVSSRQGERRVDLGWGSCRYVCCTVWDAYRYATREDRQFRTKREAVAWVREGAQQA